MIDFDAIDDWGPRLTEVFERAFPSACNYLTKARSFDSTHDALMAFLSNAGRERVIGNALDWLREELLVAHHGTRLSDDEIASVNAKGLLPLSANSRRKRLQRILSRHASWSERSGQLEEAIFHFGAREGAGRREGQVHLTLSRAGLVHGFNHYLRHGAEFDQRVVEHLFGEAGLELLAGEGRPRLLTFAVPGADALDAANPFFSVDDTVRRGIVPNLLKEVLAAWAYWYADPSFDPRCLELDCGLIFFSTVPSNWLLSVETLDGLE